MRNEARDEISTDYSTTTAEIFDSSPIFPYSFIPSDTPYQSDSRWLSLGLGVSGFTTWTAPLPTFSDRFGSDWLHARFVRIGAPLVDPTPILPSPNCSSSPLVSGGSDTKLGLVSYAPRRHPTRLTRKGPTRLRPGRRSWSGYQVIEEAFEVIRERACSESRWHFSPRFHHHLGRHHLGNIRKPLMAPTQANTANTAYVAAMPPDSFCARFLMMI